MTRNRHLCGKLHTTFFAGICQDTCALAGSLAGHISSQHMLTLLLSTAGKYADSTQCKKQ